jgi:hypothetical protein
MTYKLKTCLPKCISVGGSAGYKGCEEASDVFSISEFVSEAMFQIVTNVLLLNAVLAWSLCHYCINQ